ncbi:DNA primase [Gibbsiella quercinecans]|uniref:DUF927 domain-containing protein n=1 Tax=Gibbsiella quercinecans TaxID=929813 RepID=UPI000EF1C555|nr:DUF927 domain-containing protein [Gibbsiella quercinecans]RLM02137.1 DNA primase [Gibbsiella quercinecans]
MKSAPNVKQLPKDKLTEAIIFAGANAYAHARHWIESEGHRHGDNVPPIYLGKRQLAELDNLRIIDKGRQSARVYLAGDIESIQINAIGEKLALAGVLEAKLYKGIPDREPENWREYLARVREQAEQGQSLVEEMRKASGRRKPVDELAPRVESRSGGLYWVTPKIDKQSGEVIRPGQWLCGPVDVLGAGEGDGSDFVILRWQPVGNRPERTEAIPAGDIGNREGWSRLSNRGLRVTAKPHLRAILADHLTDSDSGELWNVATLSGWQHGVYIMPDGEIIGDAEKRVVFHGRSATASGYTVAGTAQSWRDNVAALVVGNPSMMLGVAAALVAPLVGLVGADGFGVHFFQQSSAGKTTMANIASSLYGNPDMLRLTWYGTALGIANEAQAHHDGLLTLDEVGQGADPKSVATSAYTLFNGSGKLQGAKDGGNRELKRWRTVAISTGEMDIETYLLSHGIKPKAGQLVRLLNIPLSKAVCFHSHQNGKQHADALKDAYQHHHGAAGREWVKWLADHQQQAIDIVRECEFRWRSLIPDDYGEQVHRVGSRFAILEAALLLGKVITGWDEQTSRDAIQYSYNAWLREFGTGNKEHMQIIEQTEAFLNAFGLSRYAPLPYDSTGLPIRDLAGYRQKGGHETDPMIFYTFPAAFENEIARGFNARLFADVLKKAGMLTPPNTGRGYQRKSPRIDGRQINVYVLQYLPEDEQQV